MRGDTDRGAFFEQLCVLLYVSIRSPLLHRVLTEILAAAADRSRIFGISLSLDFASR